MGFGEGRMIRSMVCNSTVVGFLTSTVKDFEGGRWFCVEMGMELCFLGELMIRKDIKGYTKCHLLRIFLGIQLKLYLL